jgi:outer membrane protein
MQANYQNKAAAYAKTKAKLTKLVRVQKETELAGIQKTMQAYSTQAQQKVEAKQNELAKPLLDKIKLAVNQVAKEKGYTLVIDSTQGILLVAPDEDNLMAAVKAKLAIK